MTKSVLATTQTGEIQLTITIPVAEVKKTYQQVLTELTQATQIAGFRKGKAPKKLVEEQTDKNKIYEQVIQKIIPQVYLATIKQHNLKPILLPKVELLKVKEGEDWEIRATTCETPKVDLGNYKEDIRKVLASSRIWTPKTTKPKKDSQDSEDEKIQKTIQTLLQNAATALPEILVEEELNRVLANLINQTEKLGLTIDQYLASINKTSDQLRAEYRQRVESDLRLQFILDAIAKTENIGTSEKEIDDLVTTTGDEELKRSLNSAPQRESLMGVLTRRKTLDFLTKL